MSDMKETPTIKEDFDLQKQLKNNAVPIMFVIICSIGCYYARLPWPFLINEIITRMARNSFLVISLIIPIIAGMGLNFGIVLGAMAAQFALIAVVLFELQGVAALLVTIILMLPMAIFFGWMTGALFNMTRGKEMITGIILSFFANGVYQLICLWVLGAIIPIKNPAVMLPSGVGLRNTINLKPLHYVLDRMFELQYGMIRIPVVTFLVILLLCVGMHFLLKTKLGQDFRAVGQSQHIAGVSGINVDKTRIIAIVLSTILAAMGQVIFLQNLGILTTYGSHVQVGTFAVAAILVGGASVSKATIPQALLGTLLFHTLFIVSPLAGKNLLGSPQVGEFFRVFIAYGVIGVALALHAWKGRGK
ncbi:ABC transporter permease [Synergistaceae bacterium OttesenSCG-928-D05]|nr:ABC transporter permease [Synergistaceae bacterium OttesenSCG-928-D05]